jgi:hypothetical protein
MLVDADGQTFAVPGTDWDGLLNAADLDERVP